MSHSQVRQTLKLDPWAASSLLQKAIRRGEAILAQHAAAVLHQYRGKAVFRRLTNIAVEDIGIADLDLVWEATRLATDKQLREVLGSDDELIRGICTKLALAPKDRSADYVFCAATKLPTALEELDELGALSRDEQIAIAATMLEPLMKRYSAAMLPCTNGGRGEAMIAPAVELLLEALPHPVPKSLEHTILTLAEQRAHPYSLTVVLLWSQYHWSGGAQGIAAEPLPPAELVGGVPLYIYDKHTAVGKRALAMLAKRSAEVRDVLDTWVPKERHAEVAQMAAFYLDGAPISRRLEWFGSRQLEFIGMYADMMSVGCSYEAVRPVMETVWRNLAALNKLRREVLSARNR